MKVRFKDLVFVGSMYPGIEIAGVILDNGTNVTVVREKGWYSVSDRGTIIDELTEEEVDDILETMQSDVVDSATNFSSRFMPNVKFTLVRPDTMSQSEADRIFDILKTVKHFSDQYSAFTTLPDGSGLANGFESCMTAKYKLDPREEVSIYEAIPELVPKHHRYNKETDSIVPDVLSEPNAELLAFDELFGSSEHIKQIMLAKDASDMVDRIEKLNNIKEYGTEYHPDDVAFKKDESKIHDSYGNCVLKKDGKLVNMFRDEKHNGFYYLDDKKHRIYVAKDKFTKDINGMFEKFKDLSCEAKLTEDTRTHRDYNVGASDYAQRKIQPWDIWEEYDLDPWDADIVKRILRKKDGEDKTLDYEKIKHICDKKIDLLSRVKS